MNKEKKWYLITLGATIISGVAGAVALIGEHRSSQFNNEIQYEQFKKLYKKEQEETE